MRHRIHPHAPVILFQSSLASQRSAFLWDYTIHGTPHIPSSAIVSMAASCLPLMAGSEDVCAALAAQGTPAAVGQVVCPAPLPLSSRRKILSDTSIGTIMLGLDLSAGHLEAQYAGVSLLFCSLRSTKNMLIDAFDGARMQRPKGALSLLRPMAAASMRGRRVARGKRMQLGRPRVFFSIAPLGNAEAQGFVVHPAVLETCLTQQAWHVMARKCASTWVRSLRRLVLNKWQASGAGGFVSCGFFALDLSAHGGFSFTDFDHDKPAFYLGGVEIREHQLPTTKIRQSWFAVGPFTESRFGFEATEATQTDKKRAGVVREAYTTADVLAGLRREEMLRRLEETVMKEVREMLGRPVHPDDPLMMSGLDSRAGMEFRRILSTATALDLPVGLLYDYQTVNAIVQYLATLVAKRKETKMAATATAPAEVEEGTSNFKAQDKEDATEVDNPVDVKVTVSHIEEVEQVEDDVEQEEEDSQLRELGNLRLPVDFDIRHYRLEEPPDPHEDRDHPSDLLKVVRSPPRQRPIFLASPGLNTAQAAYFTFVHKYLAVRWRTRSILYLFLSMINALPSGSGGFV